jgi:hypothetical protein
MTVYAVGGEPATFDLVPGHNYATSVDTAHYDDTLSRGAVTINTGVSEVELPFGTEVSEVYIHLMIAQQDVAAGNYIDIKNSSGAQTQYRIVINADATWTFQRYDGSAFVNIGDTSSAMFENNRGYVDIYILQDNTNGKVDIYKDTVNVLTFTGDTSTPNQMGRLRFIGLPTAETKMHISQVIVANESLINWRLGTLAPVGDGDHTDWTGDYTMVDEFVPNANDFCEINSVNALETFDLADINPNYSTYNVKAVVTAGRVSNDAGSIVNDCQFVVRTSDNDYTSPNMGITKDGTLQSKQHVWENNPHTSNPWTISEVNGLQSGFKSV